jgi:feruloyl-CoA synthase
LTNSINGSASDSANSAATAKYRAFDFGVTRIQLREGETGVQYLSAVQPLSHYANSLGERLQHWAATTPDRILFAQREKLADGTLGGWQKITFQQAYESAQHIGQALLNRGLNQDRPVAILSENSIDHALVALGCILVGIPFCPVSTAYSLISQDFEKLRHVLSTITPGLIFTTDPARYGKAIKATHTTNCEVVLSRGAMDGIASTNLSQLLNTPVTSAVADATAQVNGETIAKFLFTSGSTKLPKGVVNTHKMWCANQQQMRQSMPILAQEPPILVDWLPWNHTFGGNHNFGMVVYNGGTMYIDDGKPVPALIHETLRNLREIAPTAYFNVPTGFEAIAIAMKTDDVLRKNLLSRVKFFFYAGAALAQPIWDNLHSTQEAEIGERIVMGTGLGMTESAPFGLFVTSHNVKAGYLGVPTPGLELKLVPINGKTEIRYRGPNITPGYWRNSEATEESFDEEGFFKTGDAVLWIDQSDLHQGLRFDGRIAEDFKLATGTFVSVGPMRAKLIAAGAPYVQDVVLTGINLKEVGALVFTTQAVRKLAALPESAALKDVLESPAVQAHFQQVLKQLAQTSTGSASRIARMHLLNDAPSIDKGEVTDKGSINQRAVLQHRANLVESMHDDQLLFTIKA